MSVERLTNELLSFQAMKIHISSPLHKCEMEKLCELIRALHDENGIRKSIEVIEYFKTHGLVDYEFIKQ